VRVDSESFEDIRPTAAVAANAGSAPNIVIGCYDVVTRRRVRDGHVIAIGLALVAVGIAWRGRMINAERGEAPLQGTRRLARWESRRPSTMEWACTTW